MSTIGSRIRNRREELNLSQNELGKRLGYKSRSSINKIELDQRNLTQSKIKAIADALETTPAYIMGWDESADEGRPRSLGRRLQYLREQSDYSIDQMIELYNAKYDAKIDKSALCRYENGLQEPIYTVVANLADFFGVSVDYLIGSGEALAQTDKYPSPNITEDYATFPVLGDIAAGYDHIASEDWEGEQIDVPSSYLGGRKPSEFFVLRVKGESMFPAYQDGDRVLVLKQETMDYSGQVGAVLYEDDCATLKRIEYRDGEDWVNLVPINPNFPTIRIVGEDLEHCRILGVPRLVIRELP